MSWSTQRKFIVILIVLLVISLPTFLIIKASFFSTAPTCTDGVRNQNEQGTDCGGPCSVICKETAKQIVPVWDPRIFEIADGVYTAVVMVANPNVGAEAKNLQYSFKAYDSVERDTLIFERKGSINIYPEKSFPIIETGIVTGKRDAGRIVFSFLNEPVWTKAESKKDVVFAESQELLDEETKPRVTALLRNGSFDRVSKIDVIAIAFDVDGNAIGASKTYVEALNGNEARPITFTWLEPFESKVAKVELYARERDR